MTEQNEQEKATPESLSSVELSRNAKGGTQIKVKVYNEDPRKSQEDCVAIYKELCDAHAV